MGPMWLIFAILLVVWVVGIHFLVPGWLSIALFAAMIGVLALALLPGRRNAGYVWKTREF